MAVATERTMQHAALQEIRDLINEEQRLYRGLEYIMGTMEIGLEKEGREYWHIGVFRELLGAMNMRQNNAETIATAAIEGNYQPEK